MTEPQKGEHVEYREIEGKIPEPVFRYFKELSAIPRGSGNTRAASDYCVRFAVEHGLSYRQDAADNVIIYKEATKGYEHAPTVMLQGHLDMVCGKDPGVAHDFSKDGIRLILDGDELRADGTTLGGDDGIAAAYALAILATDEISHPNLECVFTSDEEIGMVGAEKLDMKNLHASYLLNLDSEEEGCFLAGCAGGIRYDIQVPLVFEKKQGTAVTIRLSGLFGGHSGADIHLGRANAIMVLAGVLDELFLHFPTLGLIGFSGGSQDNAIPREGELKVLVPCEFIEQVRDQAGMLEKVLKKEYGTTDPGLTLTAEVSVEEDREHSVLSDREAARASAFLLNLPNGVFSMSKELPGLVETSMNVGIVSLTENGLSASCLIRSSKTSGKRALRRRLEALTDLAGGSFFTSGDYPEWEFVPDSPLLELLKAVYREQYGAEPRIETIHAGVECGLFAAGIPGLMAVSLGPDIRDIHSPRERMSVSSVNRVWNFLIEVLKRMKDA